MEKRSDEKSNKRLLIGIDHPASRHLPLTGAVASNPTTGCALALVVQLDPLGDLEHKLVALE